MSATDEKQRQPRRPRREFTAEFKAGAMVPFFRNDYAEVRKAWA
ncbi:hypothetical protein OV208_28880 [Corallococcus sp. bb12-1]|nr:hypothetical protein [Corallococcus sp. bb12-1]MCY1045366.1 hypothetical protein [Corallococcus sp. bb12-1]